MATGSVVGATMTPSDSSYANRKWHCKLDWVRTDYDTYSSINITVTFVTDYAGSWGQVGNYLRGDGYVSGTKGIDFGGASWTSSGDDKVIGTYTQNVTRTQSAQAIAISGSVWLIASSAYDVDGGKGKSTASTSVTVPALANYAVSYNSNGGSGTIPNQTKWYGANLTLSSGSGFSRQYYSLIGWNTAADGSGTHYDLGATYTANAALTLYAEWELNSIGIDAKANGTWVSGIVQVKVNGSWVIPHIGFVKVNGSWEQITKE